MSSILMGSSVLARGTAAALVVSMSVLGLSGCGPKRLRQDFVGYEYGYAQTSNRELLLNLARLENHDPTYFFKIGQIASSYHMQSTLTGNGSYSLQTTNPGFGAPIGGSALGFNYENDPSFTFIPVNDDTNAQFLLKPIDPAQFYALYLQGWRVDQLFRLMVERVEMTVPKYTADKKVAGCTVVTFRNLPPQTSVVPAAGTPERRAYDVRLSQYVVFLRIAAILYELQRNGKLVLTGTNPFVAYDVNSGIPDDGSGRPPALTADTNATEGGPVANALTSAARANPPGDVTASGGMDAKGKGPQASDLINALSKDAVWELQNGKWYLGHKVTGAAFYLQYYESPIADMSKAPGEIAKLEEMLVNAMPQLASGDPSNGPSHSLVNNVLQAIANGFTVTPPDTQTLGLCPSGPDAGKATSRLVMRSMLGIMAAAAQEQEAFKSLMKSDPNVTSDAEEALDNAAALKGVPPMPKTDGKKFSENIPSVERLPLLTLQGGGEQPLIKVSYAGKTYEIANTRDEGEKAVGNEYWDRDVFRLVNQLSSQVTVDISKFPLPSILQLSVQ
jgi:hypothetical protein